MTLISWTPDHEYETIKIYLNGKEYNMKDKKDREKLRKVQHEEKYKIKMAKMMEKYGIPKISKWVKKNPNTMTRLTYELYLEEERNISIRQVWAYIILGIALVLTFASIFVSTLAIVALVSLFASWDMQTNIRIDKLYQMRWKDMVFNMYYSEKEAEDDE